MPASKTVADVVKKWSQNLSNAKGSIEAGVRAVTVAPTQIAAGKLDKYVRGVQAAVESGKMQRSLLGVSLISWQNAMVNKGLQRLANGVKEGESKVATFMQKFLPYAQQVSATIRQMPDDTESEREARMLENVRAMRRFSMSG